MGYMRHHAIVVTTYKSELAAEAHKQATALFQSEPGVRAFNGISPADMITPVLESPVNGYCSFAILPDGSKEGWADSDVGDTARAEFVKWLESQRYVDGSSPLAWVEVQYGDDEGETRIVGHSDAPVDPPAE